jgi:large subunit ribosomal protein L24
MKYKINDQVKITLGKDKGKTGVISKVIPVKGTVVIKGINLYKRHLKTRGNIQGGIFDLERPLAASKVALICPACKKVTRIGYSQPAAGDKIRICKKCQAEIVFSVPAKTKSKTKSKA